MCMEKYITKIKLHNYKKFTDFSIELGDKTNIFVGDNDAGKSSILNAVDLVLNASNSKVATIGFENLINVAAIDTFLAGERTFENLPEMWVELYLNEQNSEELNGKNNSDGIVCDGLRLTIAPTDALQKEIIEFLKESKDTFPFDYYHATYTTFSGDSYYSYRKYLRSTLIDNTKGSDDYVLSEFIKNTYHLNVEGQEERAKHHAGYRAMKADFTAEKLKEINDRMDGDYAFHLKTTAKSNLETDLSVTENGISLENHGKGQQSVMKAELTLKKSKVTPDVVLIEEPENHLSHVNMHKLLNTITSNAGQLLISTHSNLISSRLNLQHCILVNGNSEEPLKLTGLSDDTSDYFMKAPPHNVLDFVLSKKVILVEGIAEYILAEKFYEAAVGRAASSDNVHIIEVGGTAFKRYLELAKILGIKTVVIRDNDGDVNQADNYSDFASDTVKIYTDQNSTNTTFEISFYNANASFCDGLFSTGRRTLTVQQYMLNNKTDAAFEILKGYGSTVAIPSYISDAMKWISE
ncbi:hypothetical protein B7Z17_00295 [Candidatus Saccharibacteria bacterium 32-49-10]|nr:MAG: hypothetical protein B7Z17_00295 [Candidatus Saccharibacteria bacterium 32-49-10]